jgi:hypothetical protein
MLRPAVRGGMGGRDDKDRNLAEPGPERQNGQVYSADFL